ncbi:MAG: transcriptional regulator NrdR [Gemmatimonadota bacterium]|nr:transcriptional regulator NrdR [Gemmatimonadota bacterium]
MRCPSCEHEEDRVVDSRSSRGGRATRRRRECLACGHRYTTYERIEEEPLLVQKRPGGTETYDRGKLIASIRVACAKRPVSNAQIEALVNGVEEELEAEDTREIESVHLGEMVMRRLRSLDQVAYVRFASVYRNFQDTTEFMEEVRELVRRAGYNVAGQADLFGPAEEE